MPRSNQPGGQRFGLGHMAYAFSDQRAKNGPMKSVLTALPPEADTVAELRDLYRAAEARAARLRLLSSIGQELAVARPSSFDETLQRCARNLGLFLGSTSGRIERPGREGGIAIHGPGSEGRVVARILIDGYAAVDTITDKEDRETFDLCLNLFGVTIDRLERERERSELLQVLQEREQRLEFLVGRIFVAQEDERRRISQDLHDGVAQTATALARMLEGGGAGMVKGLTSDERGQLAVIARDLLKELRAVIAGLRPTLLDDLGLAAALQAMADGLAASGYDVTILLPSDPARLPPQLETALFRVAQEAIANIRKHAGGLCAVEVELCLDDPQDRYLRICDSGVGIQPQTREKLMSADGNHVGIEIMHERMAVLGGRLEFVAGKACGVSVKAVLPGLAEL